MADHGGESVYQRATLRCILAGDTDEGGLATRMPVLGLTMGMAFLDLTAAG